MQPDTTKIWTRAEFRVNVGKILVESLGVDEATVTDQAALVADLGAESIDFLDISFKCQQTFGVDLPARLIQDRLIEWRDLGVLAKVVEARYGVAVAAEELRTIAPATVGAVLQHLGDKHGVDRAAGDERAVVTVLVTRCSTSSTDPARPVRPRGRRSPAISRKPALAGGGGRGHEPLHGPRAHRLHRRPARVRVAARRRSLRSGGAARAVATRMRFVFVDRIVTLDVPRRIETSKNVSGLEDVFDDHFPGYPVLPGRARGRDLRAGEPAPDRAEPRVRARSAGCAGAHASHSGTSCAPAISCACGARGG